MAAIPLEAKPMKFNPGLLAWLALIGLLLLVGLVSAIQVFWNGLVITNMSNTVPWGLWITIDLSSIALGAGAFTLSAIVYLLGLKHFKPIIRLAVFVGFIGYSCALLTLIMDIGRPDRFLASLGLLEYPFGLVGNYLVHHHLSDHHDRGIPACRDRIEVL